MKLSRFLQPMLLAFALLFAQQAGAAHALHHAFEDLPQHHQEDKQAPHSNTCEKCADYAQLSSALNVGASNFIPLFLSDETVQQFTVSLRFVSVIAAVARAPPYSV